MNNPQQAFKFKTALISEIAAGDYLLNLDPVLEKEALDTHYKLIIDR